MRQFVGRRDNLPLNVASRERVRPTDQASIVRLIEDGSHIVRARWWLVPWFHRHVTRIKLTTVR